MTQFIRITVSFFLLIVLGVGVAPAQSVEGDKQPIKVTGQILDGNNEPIIGVAVVIDGTRIGAATDFDGNYTLDAWLGAELQVTCVGYETVKTTVCGNVMNIRLLPERFFQFFPIVPIANSSMKWPYIYGYVYDHYGRPLPGAVIKTTSSAKDVTTDDSGYFAINAQRGDSIGVSCPHYQSVEGVVEAIEFTIRLDPE
ncbi:MAG: carboxypeptidase-like regulatory domain-containing protein [Muribaculaceae bacterium]|nr:carboxypeptidase-like regulatory domain-containing protein [Muribaculaceae bacterium]